MTVARGEASLAERSDVGRGCAGARFARARGVPQSLLWRVLALVDWNRLPQRVGGIDRFGGRRSWVRLPVTELLCLQMAAGRPDAASAAGRRYELSRLDVVERSEDDRLRRILMFHGSLPRRE